MAVLWPTSWVGSPFRRTQERGRERITLSCAVMIRPAFGHLLERTSPAQYSVIYKYTTLFEDDEYITVLQVGMLFYDQHHNVQILF